MDLNIKIRDSHTAPEYILKVLIGEARGIFMANKRKEAFRIKYNKELNFYPSDILDDDFAKACRLIDKEKEYKEFEQSCKEFERI